MFFAFFVKDSPYKNIYLSLTELLKENLSELPNYGNEVNPNCESQ